MSKPVISGITVGVLAATIPFGASLLGASLLGTSLLAQPTYAADDCLAAPNRAPAPGGHWYFHHDHASDRKCWYLVEPPPQTPIAQAPQSQPAPDPLPPPPPPGLGSFFSSLGFAAPPPPNTIGDPRIAQPAPADDPRTGEAERTSRMALASKQHRLVHLRTPAEHTDERPAASLNQAERDALFGEFLKWRERQ
jgi:hypothetical protein